VRDGKYSGKVSTGNCNLWVLLLKIGFCSVLWLNNSEKLKTKCLCNIKTKFLDFKDQIRVIYLVLITSTHLITSNFWQNYKKKVLKENVCFYFSSVLRSWAISELFCQFHIMLAFVLVLSSFFFKLSVKPQVQHYNLFS
jgi:hypothetical protein